MNNKRTGIKRPNEVDRPQNNAQIQALNILVPLRHPSYLSLALVHELFLALPVSCFLALIWDIIYSDCPTSTYSNFSSIASQKIPPKCNKKSQLDVPSGVDNNIKCFVNVNCHEKCSNKTMSFWGNNLLKAF